MALQGRAYRRNIFYNLGVWHKTQSHKRKHRWIQIHKVRNCTLKASINNIGNILRKRFLTHDKANFYNT